MARDLQPCGTVAAYKRHLRHGEEPCETCLAGKRAHQARRRAAERVPESPVPVPEPPSEDAAGPAGVAEELRWQVELLRGAIKWAAENDPGKMPALAKERRETLAALADLGDEDVSEGGALGEFLSGPTGLVRFPAAEDRKQA